ADINPTHGQGALPAPGTGVRGYNTADGSLAFQSPKHQDTLTAAAASQDRPLPATADRTTALVVCESQTGRAFQELRGHATFITDVSWRLDSNVLASSSEDGTVRLWEMENGGNIKTINAHGGGVASVRFAKDGRLVTTGRDRVVRLWDPSGNKQRDFEGFNDLALRAVITHDDSRIIGADFSGEVRVWDARDGRRLANLTVNPAPLAVRLEQANRLLAATQAEADSLAKQLAPPQAAATAAPAVLAQSQGKATAAEQAVARQNATIQQFDQSLKAKVAAIGEARATLQAAEQLASQTASAQSAADATANQSAQAEK